MLKLCLATRADMPEMGAKSRAPMKCANATIWRWAEAKMREWLKIMRKTRLALVALFVLVASPLLADDWRRATSEYDKFELTQTDLREMVEASDRVCLSQANRMHNASPSIVRCTHHQALRFEVRLHSAYAAALTRLPDERASNLQYYQSMWSIHGQTKCREQFADEIRGIGTLYSFSYAECRAREFYRRAVWLERLQ
jgi:uncharacterized protein YecT (DUF1311 family)